jgi:hypothetical protein
MPRFTSSFRILSMPAAPQSFQQIDETVRHAPLPWRLAGKGTIRGAGNNSWVCSLNWRDRPGNAKLLVEAVNSHEALKARIQELETALSEAADRLEARGHKFGAEQARAALSKGAA